MCFVIIHSKIIYFCKKTPFEKLPDSIQAVFVISHKIYIVLRNFSIFI